MPAPLTCAGCGEPWVKCECGRSNIGPAKPAKRGHEIGGTDVPMVREILLLPERAPVARVPALRPDDHGRDSRRGEKSVSEYGAEILATSAMLNTRRDGKPRVRRRVPLAHIANGTPWMT